MAGPPDAAFAEAALEVLNVEREAVPIGAPEAPRAAVETAIVTVVVAGNALDGVKTRTVPFSAQATRPAIDLPPAFTVNARAVLRGSIRSVKRTDSTASRGTLVVSAKGRNLTTAGPRSVCTVRAADSRATPFESRAP